MIPEPEVKTPEAKSPADNPHHIAAWKVVLACVLAAAVVADCTIVVAKMDFFA